MKLSDKNRASHFPMSSGHPRRQPSIARHRLRRRQPCDSISNCRRAGVSASSTSRLRSIALSAALLPHAILANSHCPEDYVGRVVLTDFAGCLFCHNGRETFRIECPEGAKYDVEKGLCEWDDGVRSNGIRSTSSLEIGQKGIPTTAAKNIESERFLALNPFLPDYQGNQCKNDQPAQSWQTDVEYNVVDCCNKHFNWNLATCIQNSNNILMGISDGTPDSSLPSNSDSDGAISYYPDATVGICKENGPNKPSWIAVWEFDYAACCSHMKWNLDGCLAADPTKDMDPMSAGATISPPTIPSTASTSATTVTSNSNVSYYCDPSTGICKVKDDATPDWIKNNSKNDYSNFEKCCEEESWDIPSCLAAKPDGLQDLMGDAVGDDGGQMSVNPDIVIEISIFGSISLYGLNIPPINSPDFSTLKIAFTKSIISTMQDSAAVHPSMDVQLWSIDGENFNWRRDLTKKQIQKNYSARSHIRRAANNQAKVLEFEMIVPTLCNHACQTNVDGNIGEEEFNVINEHFKQLLTTGYFTYILNEEGTALGLFAGSNPSASSGELVYSYAIKSDLTWMPTSVPTSSPTATPSEIPSSMPTYVSSTVPSSIPSIMPSTSTSPTGATYYGDYENGVCKISDGGHSEFTFTFFNSLEDCCSFAWMKDYDHCIEFSLLPPTPQPTPFPTENPTNSPTPVPTTPKPTRRSRKPSAQPTPQPTIKLYYPDIIKGICLSDGNHGANPYVFTTPEDCCTSECFVYDYCMAESAP